LEIKTMFRRPLTRTVLTGAALLAASWLAPGDARAEEEAFDEALFTANNIWMMLSAALVFIMHLGFAMVESGLTRAKNTTNILFKNTFIPCVGILTYFAVGFNLMYPGEFNGFLGFAGFGISGGFARRGEHAELCERRLYLLDRLPLPGDVRRHRATIVSGAVAERVKLKAPS
jgi:Amt family ammonium transporter